jgi:hypothetical protein
VTPKCLWFSTNFTFSLLKTIQGLLNEIEVIVNSDLSKIYNWSKEWLVDFNPKKTECIIFSTNQAANKPCIVQGA